MGLELMKAVKGGSMTEPTNPQIESLLLRSRDGDVEARNELFSQYRRPLKSMIKLRLKSCIAVALDDSDILQDVFLEAHRRRTATCKRLVRHFCCVATHCE